jgi:type VI secretion system FHA domain protein
MIDIHVVSRAGAALDAPLLARFGDEGGDIGRGTDCTLVLPDPERRISRRQVMIEVREGRHFIRQVGAGLTVLLDGAPLALGAEYPLAVGAEFHIGPYLLRCQPVPKAEAAPPAAGAGAGAGARYVLPPMRRGARLEVDGAPAEASAGAAEAPTPQPPPLASHEFDLIVGESGFGTPSASAPQPKPAAPPPRPSSDALVAALYGGLGLPVPLSPTLQQLELVGKLLLNTIEGTLALLAARSIAKRELGANPTLLKTRENNPLKFSPNGHAALAHLLAPPQPGFVEPLAAVDEAFNNLRAHEVAVLAGMRAALDEVLARFDPALLGQGAAPRPMWETLLPANRKAKLWDDYVARYAEITRTLGGDFDALFSRAFLQAYEQQLAQLMPEAPRGAAR